MDTANPMSDTSQFIAFAREQMGNSENPGPLASEFINETNKPYYPSHHPGADYPNFWQVGCVFDTILDYFLALKEAGELEDGDKALMKQLMSQAVRGYQYGIVGLSAAWYDDWCWWGIAASKAFDADYEDIFGDQLEFFQTAAIDLWGLVDAGDFATVADSIPDDVWANSATESDNETIFTKTILSDRSELHTGTPNAWALIQAGANGKGTTRQNADYQYFTSEVIGKWAEPRFLGGCWQYDLSTMPFPRDDGPDWNDPKPNATDPKGWPILGVFQVTLMSGLYLSFACSLMAAAKRKAAENKSGKAWDSLKPYEAYQEPAENVVGFLTSWFEVEGHDSLVFGFPQGSLVHERTPTYAELPGGVYPPVQSYYPDAYWGGDQGLIMGALMQYRHLVSAHSPEPLDETTEPIFVTYPIALLVGVFYNMPADKYGLDNAVGPYRDPEGNSPISGDSGDYGSGSGIFWRYVLRCCRLDSSFKTEASASATVVSMAQTSGTHVNSWGNNLFRPFNTVAAAIGAWYLLK